MTMTLFCRATIAPCTGAFSLSYHTTLMPRVHTSVHSTQFTCFQHTSLNGSFSHHENVEVCRHPICQEEFFSVDEEGTKKM
uniref:Uncharacterized protein n=1 Tax=Ixodes ricinus TaxID=34613 RepID=A0A0K8RGC2_IXORI